MQTLADLVAAARDREGALFAASDRSADYSYRDACTNVWKAGNLFRHYGVREGTRVAVVAGPKEPGDSAETGWLGTSPDPLLAALGATLDGAVVDLDPPGVVDATVLVAPAAWLDRYQRGGGTSTVAYGGPPDDPAVAHFEREAWSENPRAPPVDIAPTDDALAADSVYTHGDLLAASRRVVAEYDLAETDEVALRAPVTEPGALVAGLLAPMRVGATVLLGGTTEGTVAVAGDDAGGSEETVIRPDEAAP
ncbi:MAG: hypothetical protein ABEH35_04535 [Haloarculaceae archaeon]